MSQAFSHSNSDVSLAAKFFSFLGAGELRSPEGKHAELPSMNAWLQNGLQAPPLASQTKQMDLKVLVRGLVTEGLEQSRGKRPAVFLSGGLDSSILFQTLKEIGEKPLVVFLNDAESLESRLATEQLENYDGEILELKSQPVRPEQFRAACSRLQIPIFNLRAAEKAQLLESVLSRAQVNIPHTVFFTGFGADEAFMFDYAKFEASTKALKSEIEFLSALNIPEAKPAQKYWNEQTAPYLYQALVFEKLSLRLEKQMWEEAGMKIAAPFLDERFKSAAFIRSSLDGTKTALREAFVDSLGVRIAFQAKIPTFAPHPLEGPDAKAWAELFRQTQPLQKIFANSPDTGVNILNGMERLSPTSELRNRLMLRALSFHFGCRR